MESYRENVTLGRTGLSVSRIGLGSSYGVGAAGVERAFERGINFFYWGSLRRKGFGAGLRTLAARHRDDLVIAIQSYTRVGRLLGGSLERALGRLQTDYADLLLLGLWNSPPPPRILDAARTLVEAGRARHVMVSCHSRPTFRQYIADPAYGAVMVRYNAAHTGAEREVFPHLGEDPPGVVAYTATRWGSLLDPRLLPEDERTPTATDCYRFALAHPGVDLCLSGPADERQLDEALAVLEKGPLDNDEMMWMRRAGKALYERTRSTWRQRARDAFDRMTGRAAADE